MNEKGKPTNFVYATNTKWIYQFKRMKEKNWQRKLILNKLNWWKTKHSFNSNRCCTYIPTAIRKYLHRFAQIIIIILFYVKNREKILLYVNCEKKYIIWLKVRTYYTHTYTEHSILPFFRWFGKRFFFVQYIHISYIYNSIHCRSKPRKKWMKFQIRIFTHFEQ